MRQIDSRNIFKRIYEGIRKLNVVIPGDVRQALKRAAEREEGPGRQVLCRVLENMDLAEKQQRPVCQDTGMLLALVKIGTGVVISGGTTDDDNDDDNGDDNGDAAGNATGKAISETAGGTTEVPTFLGTIIEEAVEAAYRDGYFRKSVVRDPLKDRTNSGNNLPPVIHYEMVPGDGLEIALLAKGFGSENCSALHMLKPTAGKEEVIAAIVETVRKAGGSPCPPTVLGIGLGGTMEKAAILSKKALLRELPHRHPDPWYAALEDEILEAVNALGIGPGGLGGRTTSLGVKIEPWPTHIAGLPLAVTVNCWADRKMILSWPEESGGTESPGSPEGIHTEKPAEGELP